MNAVIHGLRQYGWMLICLLCLAIGATAALASLPLSSEADMWVDQSTVGTFIIDTDRNTYLSRGEIASHYGELKRRGFQVDRNFIWYSEQIDNQRAGDIGHIKWSWDSGGETKWVWISTVFRSDVGLHLYKYGDCFISRVCGNFSDRFQSPPPPTIQGYKWNDLNGNGHWDANEPPLSGWRIILHGNGAERSAFTDGEGRYRFVIDAEEGLTPGSYALSEESQPEWKQTYGDHVVTVQEGRAGHTYGDYNFGNYKFGTIQGTKYIDKYANGPGDGDAPAGPGWVIHLYRDGESTAIASTTTDANGHYAFTGLSYGSYTVRETPQAGWYASYPANAMHSGIVITSGADEQRDFYNFQYGSISGAKFVDTTENNTRDAGDSGSPGWEIQLFTTTSSAPIATTITDSDGSYRFDRLPYGIYVIREVVKPGWVQTYPPESCHTVEITSGKNATGMDFGNFELGRIDVLKWHDRNANGMNDEDASAALRDWPLMLIKDGEPFQTIATDQRGIATFDELHHGIYHVREMIPEDWRQTCPFPGATILPGIDHIALGQCGPYTAISGLHITTSDARFGNIALAKLEKTVEDYWWRSPYSGVTVHIVEVQVPGILGNVPSLPWQGHTDGTGRITSPLLLPGTYRVSIDVPNGWMQEPQSPGYDTAILTPGQYVAITNTIYGCANREPRTIGFWKHWSHQYNTSEMDVIAGRVMVGSKNFPGLTVERIGELLSTAGKKSGPQQMATTQYLAVWLNLASERLGFTPTVNMNAIAGWNKVIADTDGTSDGVMTIHALMKELVARYNANTLSDQQWEIFKNICDAINNYQVFQAPPSGSID